MMFVQARNVSLSLPLCCVILKIRGEQRNTSNMSPFYGSVRELQLHFQTGKDTMTGLRVCGSSLLDSEGLRILADVMNF